jgi:hypothetical protein
MPIDDFDAKYIPEIVVPIPGIATFLFTVLESPSYHCSGVGALLGKSSSVGRFSSFFVREAWRMTLTAEWARLLVRTRYL